jgi:hypothetical protein
LEFKAHFGNPALRLSLWSAVCGLIGYLFYALAVPGSRILEGVLPGLRGLILGFVCGLLPLLVVVLLSRRAAKAK